MFRAWPLADPSLWCEGIHFPVAKHQAVVPWKGPTSNQPNLSPNQTNLFASDAQQRRLFQRIQARWSSMTMVGANWVESLVNQLQNPQRPRRRERDVRFRRRRSVRSNPSRLLRISDIKVLFMYPMFAFFLNCFQTKLTQFSKYSSKSQNKSASPQTFKRIILWWSVFHGTYVTTEFVSRFLGGGIEKIFCSKTR